MLAIICFRVEHVGAGMVGVPGATGGGGGGGWGAGGSVRSSIAPTLPGVRGGGNRHSRNTLKSLINRTPYELVSKMPDKRKDEAVNGRDCELRATLWKCQENTWC